MTGETAPVAQWSVVEGVLLVYLRGGLPVPEQQWNDVVDAIGRDDIRAVLSSSDGTAKLTTQQWRASAAATRKRSLLVSTITENRATLAMVKAAAWIGANISAYRWSELEEALGRLELPNEHITTASVKLLEMRQLGGAPEANA